MGKGFGLDCCDQCMRWSVFVWCVVCLVAGGGVVGVGAWLLADQIYMADLLGSNMYVASAAILISAGGIAFILSFIGCLGALKKNKCMLMTYGILLITVFLILVVAGILGFVFTKDKYTGDELQAHMNETMNEYEDDEHIKDAWDNTQSLLHCCGTLGPDDWESEVNITIPNSCYKDEEKPSSLYDEGCWTKLEDNVKDNAIIIGAVAIAIAVLLVLGSIFACCLAKEV